MYRPLLLSVSLSACFCLASCGSESDNSDSIDAALPIVGQDNLDGAAVDSASVIVQPDAPVLDANLPVDAPASVDAMLPTVDAMASADAGPVTLNSGWTLYSWDPIGDTMKIKPSYVFESNGLVAIQKANALPSAYVSDQVFENATIRGRFSVNDTSDDDYVGFVFGWQDNQHFYLLRWKQAAQGYCGSIAERGTNLAVVSSDTPLDQCADFWASVGTARVKSLSAPALNPVGWVDKKVYEFELQHQPGAIAIDIRDVALDTIVATIRSTDATYAKGRFGFYNHSQSGVRYEYFSIASMP
jgi:Thrombospondin C-terminal region